MSDCVDIKGFNIIVLGSVRGQVSSYLDRGFKYADILIDPISREFYVVGSDSDRVVELTDTILVHRVSKPCCIEDIAEWAVSALEKWEEVGLSRLLDAVMSAKGFTDEEIKEAYDNLVEHNTIMLKRHMSNNVDVRIFKDLVTDCIRLYTNDDFGKERFIEDWKDGNVVEGDFNMNTYF